MNRRTARRVTMLSATWALAALATLLWPVRPGEGALATDSGVLPAHPPVVTVQRADWDRNPYWGIVEGNLFSPRRVGPDPEDGAWSLPRTGDPAVVEQAPVPASFTPRYRLSGIVRGPDGIVALIDADPAVPGAELYRVGDPVGSYRLTEASDSVIVLTGPSGRQVLRLRPESGRIP